MLVNQWIRPKIFDSKHITDDGPMGIDIAELMIIVIALLTC